MKFLGTAIIGIAFFSTSSLFASSIPGFQSQLLKMEQKIAAKAAQSKAKKKSLTSGEDECIKIQGTWAGTCRDSDDTQVDETLVINQTGCTNITIDGESMNLSGFDSSTNAQVTPIPVGGSVISHSRWDESGKFLTVQGTAHYSFQGANVYIRGYAQGKYFLQNENLISSYKTSFAIEAAGNTEQSDIARECTYSKKI